MPWSCGFRPPGALEIPAVDNYRFSLASSLLSSERLPAEMQMSAEFRSGYGVEGFT